MHICVTWRDAITRPDNTHMAFNSLMPGGAYISASMKFGLKLLWRHNERDGVSNHQTHDCLFKRFLSADQRNHQISAALAFARGIHRWPVNSPHKGPVTRKMFPFDEFIMVKACRLHWIHKRNPQVRNNLQWKLHRNLGFMQYSLQGVNESLMFFYTDNPFG